jgi:adiponectin receptor
MVTARRRRSRSRTPERKHVVTNPAHDDGVERVIEYDASIFGARFDRWTAGHQRRLMWQRAHGWPNSLFKRLHGDNPHVRSCFRPMPLTLRECLASVFSWHNDTMNIWTHLMASFVYFVVGAYIIAVLHHEGASADDVWHWSAMNAAFVLTWFASAVYHTMRAHSMRVFSCTLICDLCGIVTTIAAFNYLTIKYELLCFPDEARLWHMWNIIGTFFNWFMVPMLMRCDASSFRTFLWCVFAANGAGTHWHRRWLTGNVTAPTVIGLLITYTISVIGLTIRNIKLPEVFAHGKYDLIGASHQVFHVVIALAPVPLFHAYISEFRAGRLDPAQCANVVMVGTQPLVQ